MKSSIVRDQSYAYALRTIKLARWLKEQKEFEIAGQILRSGTAIGANVEEALAGKRKFGVDPNFDRNCQDFPSEGSQLKIKN